jgi:hypothetical protein
MNLAELTAEVYTITGRSDRTAETLTAIKAATLKAHQSDFYYKDLFETGVAFDTSDYTQQLDYRTLIPLWRAVKYLRKYDISTTPYTPGKILDLIVPENVMDRYQVQKTDIYYVAGSYLNINSSTKEQVYLLGCYLNPDITVDGYNSWIAQDHPYAIVFDAAATVFKAIGKDEEAASYRTLNAEQLAMLRGSNIVANGY